ncbi:MAG: hypothetical protein HY791_23485 [Deltaproteobacteria bacterium]|nr:hypothetical protein [Deltaproteobacteria bacterium]
MSCSRRLPSFLFVVPGALVLFETSAVSAPPRRIVVMTNVVTAPEGDSGWTAAQLTHDLSRLVEFAPDLELVRDIDRGGRREELESCGSDPACSRRVLTEAGLDLMLSAVVILTSQPPTLSLRLTDVQAPKARSAVLTLPSDGPSATPELAPRVLRLLTDGGVKIGGRLVVTASPRDATVMVSSAASPNMWPVPPEGAVLTPGKYAVSVVLDEYEPKRLDVVVRSGGQTEVKAELERTPSIFAGPWIWLGAGVMIAAGVAAALVISGEAECICAGPDPNDCRGC